MAVINLGRVGYVHKGAYNTATTYQKYDVVLYNHGSYLYIGDTASSGHAPTDTAYWQAMLDPSAMQEATEAAVNAADAAHASALELAGQVDRLTTPFSITGNMVNCHPVSDYPLGVISHIEPVQAGSGDPSPSNVRPISGWTGAKVVNVGGNFYPDADFPIGGTNIKCAAGVFQIMMAGNQEISTLAVEYAENLAIRVPKKVKAYVRLVLVKADIPDIFFYMQYPNDSSRAITIPRGEVVAVDLEDGCWIAPYIYNHSVTSAEAIFNIEISVDELSSDFTPAQPQRFVEAQFGQTIYGGEFDWKSGKLQSTHSIITLTGTESFIAENWSGKIVYYVWNMKYPAEIGVACSHFKRATTTAEATAESMWSRDNYVAYYGSMTLDEFKAYLTSQHAAGTPVQIVVPMDTPTEIQLTPRQILSLDGVNNLWSDCGKTTVNGPNSPKVMEDRIAALEAAILNA